MYQGHASANASGRWWHPLDGGELNHVLPQVDTLDMSQVIALAHSWDARYGASETRD